MGNRRRPGANGGWRQVAPLIPLVLFAGAFAVNVTDDPSVATAALDQARSPLPSPVVVPQRAISDPANIPVPGTVGNGVDPGQQPAQVVTGLAGNGIPEIALRAYSRAQQVLAQADPSCRLPWTLVAAIGRVESDHGRHGGNVLNKDGVATPGILGPRLDGTTAARITDTDGGRYDGDTAFDRALGPMQFIPGTWRTAGVDGDGDGIRNPQDIDDAAMATAVYLCSGKTDLSEPRDLSRAVLRYNHSPAYVDLVVRIANAYAGGNWTAVDSLNQRIGGDDRATGEVEAPADDNLPDAGALPTQPGRIVPPVLPATHPPTTAPGTHPTTRPTTGPTAGPTDPTTAPRPSNPTKPPTSRPPSPPKGTPLPVLARLQTSVGVIVGTVGSTLTELTRATQYCRSELAKVTIDHPTQQQLQKCVTAYQTGGTAAVDQVIRNLLSLLGLVGLLGGGILGS
jgi:hypothetical protein